MHDSVWRGSRRNPTQLVGALMLGVGSLLLLASSIARADAQGAGDITFWRLPVERDMTDIAADADGNVWGSMVGSIFKLEPATSAFTWWEHDRGDVFGSLPRVVRYQGATIWFAGNNGRINRLDPSTGLVTGWDLGAPDLFQLAVDGDGNVWTNTLGSTCRIDTSVDERTCWATGVAPTDAIAVDLTGRAWFTKVTNLNATPIIGRLDPVSGEVLEWQVQPYAYATLTTDDLGRAWGAVADTAGGRRGTVNGQLIRIDPSTNQILSFTCPEGCRLNQELTTSLTQLTN